MEKNDPYLSNDANVNPVEGVRHDWILSQMNQEIFSRVFHTTK